jgi:hypothetical protein
MHSLKQLGDLWQGGLGIGGAGVPITYLLRDEFTTVQSAPLGATRTPEPGPGGWTTVQVNGNMSIDSQGLVVPVPAPTGWGNVGLHETNTFNRAAGMAALMAFRYTSGTINAIFGFNPSTGVGFTFDDGAIYLQGGGLITPRNTSTTAQVGTWDTSTSVENIFASVLLGTSGSYMFQQVAGVWTLLWYTPFGNSATMRVGFSTFNTAYKIRYARRRQLGSPWTTDFAIATVNVASPAHLTQYTATADAIHRLTITAPGSLANECGIRYRIQDANNYWRAYFNAAGAFRIDSVSGGTPTNRVNVAGVITAGQTRSIQVICDGNDHVGYTSGTASPHTRQGNTSVAHVNGQANIAADIGATWTVSNLQSHPRRSAVYNDLGLL